MLKRLQPHLPAAAAIAGFSVVMAALCVPVYTQLNGTYDEGAHAAGGIGVVQTGDYTVDLQHPPLARLPAGLLLTLGGVESRIVPPIPGAESERLSRLAAMAFGGRENYWRNLTLARVGTLAFVPLLIGYVWKWAHEIGGRPAAFASCALVTFSPNLLAHASLTTVDFACAAAIVPAAYHGSKWTSTWSWPDGLRAAVFVAAAVMTKYSAIPYVGATLLIYAIVSVVSKRRGPAVSQLLALAAVGLMVCWAVFGFETGKLVKAENRPHKPIDQAVGPSGAAHDFAYWAAENIPAPLVPMVRGVRAVTKHAAAGHRSFLLGQRSDGGWSHYFPIAILTKTTLPFLVLIGLGAWLRRRDAQMLAIAAPVAAILTIAILSPMNIGLRHVLPAFPFLALIAGGAIVRGKRVLPLVAVLTIWHAGETIAASPDYIPYFNQTVRGHESEILSDSNLDWGQDLQRLSLFMAEREIDEIWLNYFGSADPAVFGIKANEFDHENLPTGWVAASVTSLQGVYQPELSWLSSREPIATVGKSIQAFFVSEGGIPTQ